MSLVGGQYRLKRTLAVVLRYAVLAVLLFYVLFPLYWTLVTSLKDIQEVFRWPPTLLPENPTLEPYVYALFHTPVPLYILNSVIYAGVTSLFVVIMATLTTYGLSMYPYRGSTKIFLGFFYLRVIPPQVLWLPLIILYRRLGLVDTRLGIVIFLVALSYPLCIWMLKGLFDAFPRQLIDSAAIDGCSRTGILGRVVLPVVAPGVASIAMVSFLWAWSSFMFPFLILNSDRLKPLTVGIYFFVGDAGIQWHYLAATEIIVLLPGIFFFLFAQRHITRGLSAGASK